MKKVLYALLIIVLVGAFAASGLYLYKYYTQSVAEQGAFDDLAERKAAARQEQEPILTEPVTEAATTTATETAPAKKEETEPSASLSLEDAFGTPAEEGDVYYTPDVVDEEDATPVKDVEAELLPWYQELHDQNPDMVGWLTIEGTKIDYPVMQSSKDEPNYYLYRDFEKKQSVRGCIYAQESCDVATPSDNVTLFGHNMKDGSMFNSLGRYADQKVWEENPLIYFDTLTDTHVYKIFAVFKTSGTDGVGFAYHLMNNAEDKSEFDEFIAACKSLALYDTGITPAYGDKILCLSTCEYTLENGRFVVAAVRIT